MIRLLDRFRKIALTVLSSSSSWRGNCLKLGLCLTVGCAFFSQALAGTYMVDGKTGAESAKNRVIASLFLNHATFGPTWSDIQGLSSRMDQIGQNAAIEEWIDNQFTESATLHVDLASTMVQAEGLTLTDTALRSRNSYRHFAWWHSAVTAPDQLRQRVAWALSQIFVVNERGSGFNDGGQDTSGQPPFLGISSYYDLMVDNAFGNYRDLLGEVTYHPVMGIFLSHLKNPKANPARNTFPDENYAREVLQVFSVGIYELDDSGQYKSNKDGSLVELYDNETIKAFARVFTGLGWHDASSFGCGNSCRNLSEAMTMFEAYHDTEDKTLLGGEVLPGGQSGDADINAALDNIFYQDNVAPFISRLLIQRLVTSNPSRGYIRRVASAFKDDGSGVRGSFKAVIKAILMDKEALDAVSFANARVPVTSLTPEELALLSPGRKGNNASGLQAKGKGTEFSRLREPVLRYTAFLRAFNPTTDYYTGYMMVPSQANDMNQAPYQSPSVFNFYLPEFQPNGEILNYSPSKKIPNGAIYAPEFQVLTSVSINRLANQLRNDVSDSKADFSFNSDGTGNRSADVLLDFNAEQSLAGAPRALMERLDLLLCGGTMSDATREIISAAISEETDNDLYRAQGAILAAIVSPDCAVSE